MLEIHQLADDFFISKCGRIFKEARYSERGNREIKYKCVTINKKRTDVHRLVAKKFIQNPDGLPWVLHKDDNPLNNCVENLKWGSAKDNNRDAHLNGKFNNVKKRYQLRVAKIVDLFREGRTQRSIAKEIGVHETTVCSILKRFYK